MKEKSEAEKKAEQEALKILEGNVNKSENVQEDAPVTPKAPKSAAPISPLGWKVVDLKELHYEGAYYPAGCRMEVQKMDLATLKWIGGVNLDKITELNHMFNYVVSKHARIILADGRVVSGDWVFAMDRTKLLFEIREMNKFEAPITFRAKCSNKACGHVGHYPLQKGMSKPTENHLQKYWTGQLFAVKPEGFYKTWYYMPPTILEVKEASELVVKKIREEKTNEREANFFLSCFSFLRDPNLGANSKNSIEDYWFKYRTSLRGDDIEELNFVVQFTLESTQEGSVECEKCFQPFDTPIIPTDFKNFTSTGRKFKI